MNIKDWILPVALALATTLLVQRFILDYFFKPKESQEIATEFIAPESQKTYKPFDLEVDFIDKEKVKKEEITEVVTSWGTVTFSSHGASVQSLDFNHRVNGSTELIRTIFPSTLTEKENRCFLIALNEATPYFYEQNGYQETNDAVDISYSASFSHGTLLKKYKVYKNKHQIDLNCSCQLKDSAPVTLRIIYPSPRMAILESNKDIAGIVINAVDKFERIVWSSLNTQRGWFTPKMFGAENAYFLHELIQDPNNFAQRAYYKLVDKDLLISIVESPTITESSEWTVSFYFGPKEHDALTAVDSKLNQTLGYAGFFAPLSRLFLKILNFFHDYVGNYGLAIILLTLLIKLIFLPLSIGGEQRMKQQQELAHQMSYLKQRFANDPQRLAQEQAALIKTHGVPGMGCLPMLLQIPIFIAMRSVLATSIELYHAPMLWIHDLSARDPYYILPLLLVIGMFVRAVYAEKNQRTTLIAMGLILGAFMANFAAGLVLYFVVDSFLSIIQTNGLRYFKRA